MFFLSLLSTVVAISIYYLWIASMRIQILVRLFHECQDRVESLEREVESLYLICERVSRRRCTVSQTVINNYMYNLVFPTIQNDYLRQTTCGRQAANQSFISFPPLLPLPPTPTNPQPQASSTSTAFSSSQLTPLLKTSRPSSTTSPTTGPTTSTATGSTTSPTTSTTTGLTTSTTTGPTTSTATGSTTSTTTGLTTSTTTGPTTSPTTGPTTGPTTSPTTGPTTGPTTSQTSDTSQSGLKKWGQRQKISNKRRTLRGLLACFGSKQSMSQGAEARMLQPE